MLCIALALARDCHLGTMARWLPLAGRRDSLIMHLRRWLRHSLPWRVAYQPLVGQLLATWPVVEIFLVMDRTGQSAANAARSRITATPSPSSRLTEPATSDTLCAYRSTVEKRARHDSTRTPPPAVGDLRP